MTNSFDAFSDDVFVNMSLQTALPLPDSRETILQFCEACQRKFPAMTMFYQRESGEYVLEGDRDSGTYRWLELESRRMTGGHFNPPDVVEGVEQHRWVLEHCTYYLGVSHMDVECLDVTVGFNLDFIGNRDAVVAEAMLGGAPLLALADEAQLTPLNFEPNFVVSLDRDCYLQARLSVETRSNSYQVRTGNYDDEPISIYITVRKYPSPGQKFNILESYQQQWEHLQDLAQRIIIPRVLRPIAAAIASNR